VHDEQENEQEYFTLEISDLPGTDLDQRTQQLLHFGRQLQKLRQQAQRYRSRMWLALSLVCVLLTAFLLNGSQLYRQIQAPQPTVVSSATIILAPNGVQITTPRLNGAKTIVSWTNSDGTWVVQSGTLPAECSQGSLIGNNHLIGHYPVWITGLRGSHANIQLAAQEKKNEAPWVGWDVPFSVEIIHGVEGPISFTFIGLSSGLPPLISEPLNGIYSSTITFNPDYPIQLMAPHTDKAVSIRNFMLHLGNPGCYLVSADWPSGNWSIIFVAK
jgi:hypothetical protein